MISVKEFSEKKFLITLKPNSSLEGANRYFFIGSLSFLCFFIAILFFLFGAPLILPFAGLEILILFFAFYFSFKWSSQREEIYISEELVRIKKQKIRFREWKEYRIFVKFKVTNKSNEDFDLSFTSRGRNIVVGEFLNLEDKISLKNKIKNIIFELNSKASTSI